MGDETCGSTFGGELLKCKKALPAIAAIFRAPGTARSWKLDGFCNENHLNVLVAIDTEPVLQDVDSWFGLIHPFC